MKTLIVLVWAFTSMINLGSYLLMTPDICKLYLGTMFGIGAVLLQFGGAE